MKGWLVDTYLFTNPCEFLGILTPIANCDVELSFCFSANSLLNGKRVRKSVRSLASMQVRKVYSDIAKGLFTPLMLLHKDSFDAVTARTRPARFAHRLWDFPAIAACNASWVSGRICVGTAESPIATSVGVPWFQPFPRPCCFCICQAVGRKFYPCGNRCHWWRRSRGELDACRN